MAVNAPPPVNEVPAPISRQRVVALLHHLGGDADAIAQTLQRHAIAGRPVSAARCLIARYLSARTRDAEDFARLSASVTRDTIELRSAATRFWVDAPPALHDFVARFDRGEFADLWS